jgi:hypothetical protein
VKAIEDNLIGQAALREPESRLRRRPADPRGIRRSGVTERRNHGMTKLSDWESLGGAAERREIRLLPAR